MKRIFGLAFIFLATALLVMGCSSNKETMDNKDSQKKSGHRVDNRFKEADKVAKKYFQAIYETDRPKLKEVLAPKAVEKVKSYENDDWHESPGAFKKLNGNYEIRRYDNYYDKKQKEIYYKFQSGDSTGMYYYAALKQNPEGEWKVRDELLSDREKVKDQIPSEKTGTVIHKMSGKEVKDKKEGNDDYGF